MKNLFLLILTFSLSVGSLFGKGLKGIYTIDSTKVKSASNYTSIDSAILDMEKLGLTGNVTFRLADGNYSYDHVSIDSILNGTDTIIFTSMSGNRQKVNTSFALSNIDNIYFKNITAQIVAATNCSYIQMNNCVVDLSVTGNASPSGYIPYINVISTRCYFNSIQLSQVGGFNSSHDIIKNFNGYECECSLYRDTIINKFIINGDTAGAFVTSTRCVFKDLVDLYWVGASFYDNFMLNGFSMKGEIANELYLTSNSIYKYSSDTNDAAVYIDNTYIWPSQWTYSNNNFFFTGNIIYGAGKAGGIYFTSIYVWPFGSDYIASSNNDYYSQFKNHDVTDMLGHYENMTNGDPNLFINRLTDVRINPDFTSTTDLHSNNDSLAGRGDTYSTLDIDSNIRATFPWIGATEKWENRDAALKSNFLSGSSENCGGKKNVQAIIFNNGHDTITSSKLSWSQNGKKMNSYTWKGTLLPAQSDTVQIDTFSFLTNTNYNIKTWIDSTNGMPEKITGDDTAISFHLFKGYLSHPDISGLTNSIICSGSTLYLNTTSKGTNAYSWNTIWGNFVGSSYKNNVKIQWGTYSGSIELKEYDNGCIDSAIITIKVLSRTHPAGVTSVCDANITTYSEPKGPGHKWNVIGGSAVGGNLSDSFKVRWDSVGVMLLIHNDSIGKTCSFIDTLKVNVRANNARAKFTYSGSCFSDSFFFKSIVANNNVTTWNFGDSSYSTLTNPHHLFSKAGSYLVFLTAIDSTGCTDTLSIKIDADSSCFSAIYGIIKTSGGTALKNSKTYAVRFNAIDTSLTISAQTLTDSNGYYHFSMKDTSVYLVAYPDSSNYPHEMITWRDSNITFQGAAPVTVKTPAHTRINFKTLKGANNSGTGLINGKVTICILCKQGAHGTAASGIRLIIVDSNKNPVASTYTDSKGFFQFSNLSIGTYSIWVDKPNVDNSKAPTISISSGSMTKDSIQLVLYPTYLDMIINTGIQECSFGENSLTTYPNPFIDAVTISYKTTHESMVTIEAYDVMGFKIATLTNAKNIAGTYTLAFDPKNYGISGAGIFIIKYTIGEKIYVRQIVKLK